MARVRSEKSMKSLISLLMLLLLTIPGYSQTPDWYGKLKQLRIAHTKREELEKIFGNPPVTQIRNGTWSQTVDYKLDDGNLFVDYSTGKCSERNKTGYDLDNGVVIGVSLLLFHDVKLSRLRLNLKLFEKYNASDTNVFVYFNDELGIRFEGSKRTIHSVEYSIGNRLNYLDCKNMLTRK